MSPTLTCSNRTAVVGTSRVTDLPCCTRIVTVRPVWSTASTVPCFFGFVGHKPHTREVVLLLPVAHGPNGAPGS